jgi:hypothetical protein
MAECGSNFLPASVRREPMVYKGLTGKVEMAELSPTLDRIDVLLGDQ